MTAIAFCLWILSMAAPPAQPPAKSEPVSPPAAANPRPASTEANDVYVDVEVRRFPIPDPNRARASSQLEGAVRARLEKAQMRVLGRPPDVTAARTPGADPNRVQPRLADAPILRIDVNVLFLDAGSRAAVCSQASAGRLVRLMDGRGGPPLTITLWSTQPAMEAVPAARWEEDARKIVLQQVDAFIATSHVSGAAAGAQPPATPASSSSVAFVASKTGAEFHRPECPVARVISPQNLVTYKTREEAVAAGKRPCQACDP